MQQVTIVSDGGSNSSTDDVEGGDTEVYHYTCTCTYSLSLLVSHTIVRCHTSFTAQEKKNTHDF